MYKESPFCIQNHLGKLELTKGNYLALQKRKLTTLRTLAKTKPISKDSKSTVKRSTRNVMSSKHHQYDEVGLINR